MPEAQAIPRSAAALAVAVSLAALATALFAGRIVALLRSGPLPVFPGAEDEAYYVARLQVTAAGWAVLLPALVLLVPPLLSALRAAPSRTAPWRTLAALAAAALVASSLLPRRPTGDENAYLLMASSVARRGTLDVADADESLHRSLAARPGENRSLHDPGLSLLLALPWLALREHGARIACTILGLALGAVTFRLLPPRVAAPFALVLVVSFPIAAFAPLVLPEIAGALALAVLFSELVVGASPTFRGALAAVALPWLHVRFLAPAVLLVAWGLARRQTRGRAASRIAIPLAASLSVLALFHERWFGSPSPWAMWRGRGSLLYPEQLVPGSLGVLVDQQAGLLPWAPLFLLCPLGALLLWSRRRDVVVGALALTASVVGPGILHCWWGGWSPAARFLVAATAPLAVLAAEGLAGVREHSQLGRRLVAVLVGLQIAIGAFCLAVPGKLYGTFEDLPRNYVLDLLGRASRVDSTWLLPSLLSRPGTAATLHALILVVLWLGGSWAIARQLRRPARGAS